MNINLTARLKAYGKLDISQEYNIPTPNSSDAGKLLGVDSNGNYILLGDLANSQIDELFEDIHSRTKIDMLFEED